MRLLLLSRDLRRSALRHDPAAAVACLRAHVHDPVRLRHDVEIVLDHDSGVTGLDQPMQDVNEFLDIGHVQSYGGLVEHVEGVLRFVAGARRDVATHLR